MACITKVENTRAQRKSGDRTHDVHAAQESTSKTSHKFKTSKFKNSGKLLLRKISTQRFASKTSFFRVTAKASSGLKAGEVKRALVGFQEVPPGLRPKVATCLAKVSLLTYLVRISALFKVPKTFRIVIIPDVTSSWTNKCRSWT